MPISKILFPTDFSLHSGNALYYTVNLAARLSAEVMILHCIQYPSIATDIPAINWDEELSEMEKNSHRQMAEVIEYISRVNPSVRCKAYIHHGELTNHIQQIVKEKEIDLVMMYTKGANAAKSFFYDTNAATIVEKSACPVFVIPENYSFTELATILYLSELLESDVWNIQYLTAIASLFDAKVIVANVSVKEFELQKLLLKKFEEEVRKTISYQAIEFQCIESDNVYHCISDFTKGQNIDLIVTSTRHRNMLEKIYDHSLSKKLAYSSPIPLLAFHTHSVYQDL